MNKKTQDTLFSSNKTNWETPQELFDRLNEKYHFTLDAAASDENHKVDKYYTAATNGLMQDWGGKLYFVIPHMEVKILVSGLRNATKSPESQVQPLYC